MRPIFSPTDFIQIKGRGTRKHNFIDQVSDAGKRIEIGKVNKESFKLFDFFGNYEYFEEKFQYDQVLKLPRPGKGESIGPPPPPPIRDYVNHEEDELFPVKEIRVGVNGMKIDRMYFDSFTDVIKKDEVVQQGIEQGNWDRILDHINQNIFNKPEQYYNIEKLRRSIQTDRRITLREIVEYIFGLIPFIPSREQLLDEEFSKFIADCKPEEKDDILALKYFFKSYILDARTREIIENRQFADLNVNPSFTTKDLRAVPERWRHLIPEYIKDYVSLNKFTN
jgi:type I restriction enzyme R subunit